MINSNGSDILNSSGKPEQLLVRTLSLMNSVHVCLDALNQSKSPEEAGPRQQEMQQLGREAMLLHKELLELVSKRCLFPTQEDINTLAGFTLLGLRGLNNGLGEATRNIGALWQWAENAERRLAAVEEMFRLLFKQGRETTVEQTLHNIKTQVEKHTPNTDPNPQSSDSKGPSLAK